MEYLNNFDEKTTENQRRRSNSSRSVGRFVIGQNTIDESEELYTNHLINHLSIEGLEVPPNLEPAFVFQDNANALKMLSDIFASSPQRLWVHQRAQHVELNTLNFQAFNDLLAGLFQVSEHCTGCPKFDAFK